MANIFRQVLNGGSADTRGKIVGIYLLLAAANLAGWLWAALSFRHFPLLLGTALLAYGFGLRHATDADHIAAIDNVTRKLMQEGQRPVAVGFFFSLGHSTIVVLASVAVAATATAFKSRLDALHGLGGIIGTLISAAFLLVIAVINIVILRGVFETFRHVKAGGTFVEDDLNLLLSRSGFLARIFRPAFRLIGRSWHMYPLGVLFGLGFDTATEVGLLGISAAEASRGLPVWSILVFPCLFTAGMSLIDTTDGVLMLGAYGWAFVKPMRKLFYNMTITAVSVIVALIVGGIETLGLIDDQFGLGGPFWAWIGTLNDNFGAIGFLIIGVFVAAWIASYVIYRANRYEEIEVAIAASSTALATPDRPSIPGHRWPASSPKPGHGGLPPSPQRPPPIPFE